MSIDIRVPSTRFFVLSILILMVSLCVRAQLFSEEEQFMRDVNEKRDPFVPLLSPDGRFLRAAREAPRAQEITLEGIIYDEQGRSYAIVGGAVRGIGDYIGEYQLLKIEAAKVLLIKGGQIKELPLNKEEK